VPREVKYIRGGLLHISELNRVVGFEKRRLYPQRIGFRIRGVLLRNWVLGFDLDDIQLLR